jgi:glycerate dehydrogenase
VPLKEGTLAQLPKLLLIAVAATGHNIVDIAACNRLDICVSNVRGLCTTSIAEHVFALVFSLRRKLFAVRDAVSSGAWQRSARPSMPTLPPPGDLSGSQIRLIGHGAIVATIRPIMGTFFAVAVLRGHRPDPHAFFGTAFWIGFTMQTIAAEVWIHYTRTAAVTMDMAT